MSKKQFEYFHNHGDEDGNNSLTVCFGDPNDLDHVLVGTENTEGNAMEVIKRLNEILAQQLDDYKKRLKVSLIKMKSDNPITEVQLACNSQLDEIIEGLES